MAARQTPFYLELYNKAVDLSQALRELRTTGRTVGFVPTMGALHRGHLSLLRAASQACDLTVVSIFVNPTQFDEPADLAAYPRTPEADIRLLRENGCDLLFQPAVEDVYPEGEEHNPLMSLDLGSLTARLEGAHRPGHFAGVVQVVRRLLDIVAPDKLFLGQKDYQQVAVVRQMIERTNDPVDTVIVPTVREQDGLALSSRNRRLSPDERVAAGKINQHLAAVAAGLRSRWPARELEELATSGLASVPLLEPEYVEVVDGDTLLPYQDGDPVTELVVLAAVRVGPVRLIDNRIAFRRV